MSRDFEDYPENSDWTWGNDDDEDWEEEDDQEEWQTLETTPTYQKGLGGTLPMGKKKKKRTTAKKGK